MKGNFKYFCRMEKRRVREIPVLLLTGYLGSGKTTLVNRILSNRKGIKFAVIVNDIGEVNIDASLIEQGGMVGQKDDSLIALQNGCICCTLKMDLVQQLSDIAGMGKFDYIVIEASGICEPEPIARTICSIPYMGQEYVENGLPHLDCIVTVVDALRLRDEFSCAKDLVRGNIAEDDIESLVIQQVEFCNKILINKASEVSAAELKKIHEIIGTIQPHAELVDCDYGDIDLDSILHTGLFDYDSVSGSAAWITAVEDEDEHGEGEHGETEEYGIGTFVYFSEYPLDINKFDNFVAKHWPAGVIRAKGICYFTEEPEKCYLFEQAGRQISLTNIGQWYENRAEKIVFIGQKMDKEGIRAALDSCLEK